MEFATALVVVAVVSAFASASLVLQFGGGDVVRRELVTERKQNVLLEARLAAGPQTKAEIETLLGWGVDMEQKIDAVCLELLAWRKATAQTDPDSVLEQTSQAMACKIVKFRQKVELLSEEIDGRDAS